MPLHIPEQQEACPCQIRTLHDVSVVWDPPRGALVGCQVEIFFPRAPGRAPALGGREAAAFQGGRQLFLGLGVLHIPQQDGMVCIWPCGEGKGPELLSHLACKHPRPYVVCLYSQHPVAFRLTHMDGIIQAGPPVPLVFFELFLWGGVWLGMWGGIHFFGGCCVCGSPCVTSAAPSLSQVTFGNRLAPGVGGE